MSSFAYRLKEIRKKNKIKQIDLAHDLGLAQTTIANYERGKRFPNEEILMQLADYFNVSIDYLLGRTSNPKGNLSIVSNYNNKDNELQNLSELGNKYLNLLLEGKKDAALQVVLNALEKGADVRNIYSQVFEYSLKKVGELWELNSINVAQEHYATEATQSIMAQINMYISKGQKNGFSALCVCTSGELHTVGLKMIADFLEMDGWTVHYLGTNTPTDSLIEIIKQQKIDILALSTTMDFNVNTVENIISAVSKSKFGKKVKILVGGQAINKHKELWKRIGADGYAKNAHEGVLVANQLVGRLKE